MTKKEFDEMASSTEACPIRARATCVCCSFNMAIYIPRDWSFERVSSAVAEMHRLLTAADSHPTQISVARDS
jgi:hypothetical protein